MRNKRNSRNNYKTTNNNSSIKILVSIILILVILLFIESKTSDRKSPQIANNSDNTSNVTSDENKNSSNEDEKPKEDVTFTMAMTGDIMCHNTMYQDAYNSSDKSYDFSYMFENIKQHIQMADIAVGNLETTFAGSKVGYSGYPTFNTPEILAKNLKQIGFDVVSTANNHCMDKGYSGLVSTIEELDAADLAHTGTFKSKEDQEDILIKYAKGVSIAFLSYTYGTNGITVPKDKSFAVNLIDKDLIKKHLNLAKAKNPDMICVCMHWGVEYQTTPNSTQKDLADFLFKNGVDVIIGNHPHVPQPMEKRTVELEDGTKKDGFIIYSLGNFMANQNYKYTQDSAILKLSITKHADDGKISIDSATYTPTYMYKNTSKKSKKFKILDINNEIKKYKAKTNDAVSTSLYNTLSTELKNIERIIGKEIT